MRDGIDEWDEFFKTQDVQRGSPEHHHLIAAFFAGRRSGMNCGMEEGRKLCLRLTAPSNASAAEPVADAAGERAPVE